MDSASSSAIEIDKYIKSMGLGKRAVSANVMDKYLKTLSIGKRPFTANAMDRYVKQLTFGKRAEVPNGDSKCENCVREKKSFASFRWRPVDGML